jgi:hypothetical protein
VANFDDVTVTGRCQAGFFQGPMLAGAQTLQAGPAGAALGTGNNNNYVVPSLGPGTGPALVKLTGTGSPVLTGIDTVDTGVQEGQMLTLLNVGGVAISLAASSSSSALGNRFAAIAGSGTQALATGCAVQIIYDGTEWVPITLTQVSG